MVELPDNLVAMEKHLSFMLSSCSCVYRLYLRGHTVRFCSPLCEPLPLQDSIGHLYLALKPILQSSARLIHPSW